MGDLDPMAQIEVESEIRRLSSLLSQATEEYGHLSENAARSDVDYDLAHARMLLSVPRTIDGEKVTVPEREAKTLLLVEEEYRQARMDEAVFKAAQERGRNLRTQLDALRSINANVRAAVDYSQGRGR